MTARTGRLVSAARAAVAIAIVLLAATSAPIAQEKGTGEGIKVHGHWTIDVKNPDGTLASHHEFENALAPPGQTVLSSVLAHNLTLLGWDVVFQNSSSNLIMSIFEPAAGLFGPNHWPTLTVTTVNSQQVVLQGSGQAPGPDSITTVLTALEVKDPSGQTHYVSPFSQRALPQPIAVQQNQFVQVTVVLSFS